MLLLRNRALVSLRSLADTLVVVWCSLRSHSSCGLFAHFVRSQSLTALLTVPRCGPTGPPDREAILIYVVIIAILRIAAVLKHREAMQSIA